MSLMSEEDFQQSQQMFECLLCGAAMPGSEQNRDRGLECRLQGTYSPKKMIRQVPE